MKTKLITFTILVIFLICFFFKNLVSTYFVNIDAILSSKILFLKIDNENFSYDFTKYYQKSCNHNWLDVIRTFHIDPHNINDDSIRKVIDCGDVNFLMLKKIFPISEKYAKFAIERYPDQTYPIYWLAESIDPKISSLSKQLFIQILDLNPKDGLAWCRLGIIFLKEKDIALSKDTYKKCCLYGDPGANGCYNSGRLLEQEGRFEEAIFYYRLSRWQPSQEEADRLEVELTSQNP